MEHKKAYLFCKFIDTEIKKILEDKWLEGERQHNDPGQPFVMEWIKRNAKNWREEWDKSCCQHCSYWRVCGHKVKPQCFNFEFDKEENSNSSEEN